MQNFRLGFRKLQNIVSPIRFTGVMAPKKNMIVYASNL
jgi:hypothetical protein